MDARVHIAGCGRWAMGDDQAGLLIARRLQARALPDTVVTLDQAPGDGLATRAQDAQEVLIVVDAARYDARHPPGSFVCIDYRASGNQINRKQRGSTHVLGVDAGLELADALGMLPPTVIIYAIFGSRFDRDMNVTDAVAGGIERVCDAIEQQVRDLAQAEARTCTS